MWIVVQAETHTAHTWALPVEFNSCTNKFISFNIKYLLVNFEIENGQTVVLSCFRFDGKRLREANVWLTTCNSKPYQLTLTSLIGRFSYNIKILKEFSIFGYLHWLYCRYSSNFIFMTTDSWHLANNMFIIFDYFKAFFKNIYLMHQFHLICVYVALPFVQQVQV